MSNPVTLFQSLIGIQGDFNETALIKCPMNKMPFQSLIGIQGDFNGADVRPWWNKHVSIPDRDSR